MSRSEAAAELILTPVELLCGGDLQAPVNVRINPATATMSTPGDIKTVPFDQLWYNAPFDEFLKVRVRLTNGGVQRIGFHLKSTVGPDRIEIDPANGALDASETTTLWVTVKPFSGVDTSSDRETIEWTDAPASATKKYNRRGRLLRLFSLVARSHRSSVANV